MNARRFAGGFWMFALVMLLWGVAFSLACRVGAVSVSGEEDSIVANVIGNTRVAFGSQFFVEADRYFHKGVGHFQKAAFTDWFTKMGRDIEPRGHIHLENEGVNEVMPWLYFSTRMDPHNVVAYSVAAFFLARGGGCPDLAEQVLKEAERFNPRDYRLYFERGRLELNEGKLEDAARAFDVAIRLWPGSQDPDEVETRMDRAGMLTYRGLLYEMEGGIEPAVRAYKQVLSFFPSRTGLGERITELETSGRATSSPSDVWKMMLLYHPSVCEHDDTLEDRQRER